MTFNLTAGEWLSALSDLFLPRTCIVCGRPLAFREKHICPWCLKDIPRTFFSGRTHNQMADRFNALIQGTGHYAFATALFFYRPGTGYRNITKRLKYHSDIPCGKYFAEMLGKEMAFSRHFRDVDTVIPVPLHWTRRFTRGYNQAAVIAKVLAKDLGATVRTDILFRPGKTKTQTKLSLEEKAANVKGAFRLRKGAELSGIGHILLVDDVFTTGATLHECFKALRQELPTEVRISIATLAYVGY